MECEKRLRICKNLSGREGSQGTKVENGGKRTPRSTEVTRSWEESNECGNPSRGPVTGVKNSSGCKGCGATKKLAVGPEKEEGSGRS